MPRADTGYGSVGTNYAWTGVNLENQLASPITFREYARITNIAIHGSGYGGDAYCFHTLWFAWGRNLTNSDTVTWPYGDRRWINAAISKYPVQAGTYWIGHFCNPSFRRQWSQNSAVGTQYRKTTTGLAGMDGAWEHSGGAICCYADYETGHLKVWNGSSWVTGTVNVWNGSSWVVAKGVYTWNGSSWVTSKP